MNLFAKRAVIGLAVATSVALGAPATAKVFVGGAPMFQSMTIVENAVNSADHTTLVAAVKAADLVDTLNSDGPFTVFAPVNSAFDALPDGTVESLLKPENKMALSGVLTYHVVPGNLTFVKLRNSIEDNGGQVKLATAAGGTLIAEMNGRNNIIIKDEMGGVANITIYDVLQSNGVIHSIDKVLLPKS